MSFFDFNSASEQTFFDLIPKGALVRVRMTVKPGGFDDASQGWTGGYATRNDNTGSVYLNCEFVVMEGQYARRKMWSLIGLYSPKGPEWSNMGRTFIKAVLNSARAIHPNDNGPAAQNARRINGFADLDGIEFLGKVVFVLVFIPRFAYDAVILCEPVVWCFMALYLVAVYRCNPFVFPKKQ